MSDFLDRVAKLPPKRLALLALELNTRLERLEKRASEPVAIVGIGCRFPGGATTPDEFWRLLRDGVDAVSEVPASRWDIDRYYDPNPDAPGKMSTRWGSWLQDVDRFDAKFFGIAPREATGLDPHQRLLLEVTWEALEHAGQAPDRVMNTQTGVFVGPGNGDYYQMLRDRGASAVDAYLVSGNAQSMAAGRLSYFFGLRGPSLTIDSACSSSLVAVHLACQSLRAGECRMALAGGANLILAPDNMIGLSKAHMLSPDGRCRTFDAGANGIVRGEGCAVLVFKRLADAQADGDRILAVVLGTAINQDGRSNGITAPNGPAQEAVIREALERSGVKPADIDYVEAHGTGTPLGDPIEVRALGAVLGDGRQPGQPVRLGSVKTNVGHLEIAAGIAGLVKVVLAMVHGEIPPHLHLKDRNPLIAWDGLPVEVPTERTPWPRPANRGRLAGVSAFGFSGTNVHVVLADPPAEPDVEAGPERPAHVLALSARTPRALRDLTERLERDLGAHPDRSLADVCFTANTGRAHFQERLAIVGRTTSDMRASLAAFAGDRPDPATVIGHAAGSEPPPIVLLCTGQGSQYVGMGRELFETQPVFRRAIEACDAVLRAHSGERLIDVLYGGDAEADARIDRTQFTQPALFAVEYALAELFRSWGLVPSVVMGHSVGEYVAACVAGIMSMEDGLLLVAERARLMQALPGNGTMAAILAPEARIAEAIAPYAATVAIAAVNGPASVVISGLAAHVEAIRLLFSAQGIDTKGLKVSHAFHSPLIDPMLDAFEAAARRVTYRAPQVDVVSNLTGRVLADGEVTAAYWRRHARGAVRFADGVRAAAEHGGRLFVEAGPSPVLVGMAAQCLSEDEATFVTTLRKGRGDLEQVLRAAARLYTSGARVDWTGFDREYRRRKVTLPAYPFQRERFWPEPAVRREEIVQAGSEAWRESLYAFDWQREAAASGARRALVRSPQRCAEEVRAGVDALREEHGADVYDTLYPQLDAACAAYVVRALQTLGCPLAPGDRLAADELRSQAGVLPEHARLLARMLEILGEDGVLRRDGDRWVVARRPDGSDPDAMMRDLLARFPECGAELRFTAQGAPRLADVLTGRCDPLAVLFPGGSLDAAEALYERAPALRVFNTLVARTVAAAIAGLPQDRDLRVLEIGAGTGGTTSYVLKVLPGARTRYVYTDVSPVFTARAREKFREYDFVDYRTLNIEDDPTPQGFEAGGFDLVLAANVLHATADIRRTLKHARRLLAPGGMLVVLESTQPQRFGDLTVGYTEGWWRFTDTDLRPGYALLSAERWLALLAEAGFESAVSLPGNDFVQRAVFANQSVLVASAPAAAPAASSTLALSGQTWVVCGAGDALTRELADDIRARGGRSVVAEPGDQYVSDGPDRVALDTSNPEHVARLLGELGPGLEGRRWGAIYSVGIDGHVSTDASVETVEAAVRRSCAGALHLAQALAGMTSAMSPRLVLVTRGAQAVAGNETVAVEQAPIWGLGRVIELEHRELRCTRIDLPVRRDPGEARAIVEEIASEDDRRETQIALREDGRHLLRMARATTGVVGPLPVREDASYLITGGLAGLGLLVARWMVDRGARRLVLMGRSEASADARQVIAAMEAAGASIAIVRGDVSVAADVQRAVDAASSSGAALRGIVHSAGALDDGVLTQQRWDRFAKVMAAKVSGSWALHRATAAMPLDFFVLFSSGASFLGSAGQSNHAAANAFVDALAFARRSQGLPATSINWGAWSEVGAATRGGVVDRVGTLGLGAIRPETGLRTLEYLMRADAVQTAVLPIQWPEFLNGFRDGAVPPVFERFASMRAATSAGGEAAVAAPAAEPQLSGLIGGQTPARARIVLLDRVGREAARVLGLDPNDRIDPTQPLNALGMDSLMAVELRNALSTLAGRPLSATLLFNYPSLGELVDYFATDPLSQPAAAAAAPALAAGPAATGNLDELSEEELASLLAEKLHEV